MLRLFHFNASCVLPRPLAPRLLLAACLLSPAADVFGQPVTTQIVAITGDAPPNGDGRFRNSAFSLGGLNDQGKVAFGANLIGSSDGPDNDHGLFLGDGTTLREIVREGDPLPGEEGTIGILHLMNGVPVNALGQTAFVALGRQSEGSTYRIYRSPSEPGPLVRIAKEGDVLPDGQGLVSPSSDVPSLNDSGQLAFLGSLVGTPNDSDGIGIFTADGNRISVLVAPNQPDTAGKYLIHPQGFAINLAFNNAGEAAFFGETRTSPTTSAQRALMFARGSSSITVHARANQPVPDGAGSFDPGANTCVLNEAGHVAFNATVNGTLGQYDALYFLRDGVISEIARTGFNAPDARWRFRSFQSFDFNDQSGIAFAAADWDGASGGIFRGDGTREGLVRVVSEDQAAPDGNGTYFLTSTGVRLNNAGQILFGTTLRGTAQGNGDNHGLFLFDDKLGVLTVARRGDIHLDGRFSQIDVHNAALNNQGDVAFTFSFTDGRTGVAIWSYRALADNKPPVGPSFQGTVSLGTSLRFSTTNLLDGVSDPEGGNLFLTSVSAQTTQGRLLSYNQFDRMYSYVPIAGFVGVDEFTYIIRDDAGVSSTFVGRITVSGPNQPPTLTGPGPTLTSRTGEPVTINFATLLSAASDPDGDPLSVGTLPARTAASANVVREGDTLRIEPNPDIAEDYLDIPIQDGRGGSVAVRVKILLPDILHGLRNESGSVVVTLSGSTGIWTVRRAASLQGPWTTLGTLELIGGGPRRRGCPAGTVCRGSGEFRDANPPPGIAFYQATR